MDLKIGDQVITTQATTVGGATVPTGVVGTVTNFREGGYVVQFNEMPYATFGSCHFDGKYRLADAIEPYPPSGVGFGLGLGAEEIYSAMQAFARLAED